MITPERNVSHLLDVLHKLGIKTASWEYMNDMPPLAPLRRFFGIPGEYITDYVFRMHKYVG